MILNPFSLEEVSLLDQKLCSGNSKGYDCIPAEVIKVVVKLIERLFLLTLKYNFLPEQLMQVILAPIMKNKTLDTPVANDYRPIAIPTSMPKLLELFSMHENM